MEHKLVERMSRPVSKEIYVSRSIWFWNTCKHNVRALRKSSEITWLHELNATRSEHIVARKSSFLGNQFEQPVVYDLRCRQGFTQQMHWRAPYHFHWAQPQGCSIQQMRSMKAAGTPLEAIWSAVLWLARRVVAAADTLMKIANELQTKRIADDEGCRLSACFVHNLCFFLQPL